MRNWLINTEPKQLEYYKGILIHADTGVHEQAAASRLAARSEIDGKYYCHGCAEHAGHSH